ncbi:MAG: hypothetical protein KAX90_00165 [Pseudomonas sp.]|nr:hypothetical protein [Pseudomonas sp.]
MRLLWILALLFPLSAAAVEDKRYYFTGGQDGPYFSDIGQACAAFDYSKIAVPVTQMNPRYAGSWQPVQNAGDALDSPVATCKYDLDYHLYGDPSREVQTTTSQGAVVIYLALPCRAGDSDYLTWPRFQEDDLGQEIPGTKVPMFSNPVCVSSCKANHTSSVEDCYYNSTRYLFCVFRVSRTGESCATAVEEPELPEGCPEAYELVDGKCRLKEETDPDPCETDPTGPGCGDTGGGDTGGGDTGGGDTGGGDTGGGDTGGGDTGGGDTGGGDTGGGDTGGGDTGGGTNPGDGSGDGNGSAVAGEDCAVALSCQGDAIQCAILRAAKAARCAEQFEFGSEEKAAVEELLSGEEYQIPEKSIDVGELLEEGTSAARWLPSSCPQPRNIVILGRSYAFSWQPLCDFAAALGPIILALAALFFIVHVGRGVKE